jgi:hypothetical protein
MTCNTCHVSSAVPIVYNGASSSAAASTGSANGILSLLLGPLAMFLTSAGIKIDLNNPVILLGIALVLLTLFSRGSGSQNPSLLNTIVKAVQMLL